MHVGLRGKKLDLGQNGMQSQVEGVRTELLSAGRINSSYDLHPSSLCILRPKNFEYLSAGKFIFLLMSLGHDS